MIAHLISGNFSPAHSLYLSIILLSFLKWFNHLVAFLAGTLVIFIIIPIAFLKSSVTQKMHHFDDKVNNDDRNYRIVLPLQYTHIRFDSFHPPQSQNSSHRKKKEPPVLLSYQYYRFWLNQWKKMTRGGTESELKQATFCTEIKIGKFNYYTKISRIP